MFPTEVTAKLPEIKKTVSTLRQQIVDMVEARFPKQEEESNYIGMRKVRTDGGGVWRRRGRCCLLLWW
jgi:hypothetical protein